MFKDHIVVRKICNTTIHMHIIWKELNLSEKITNLSKNSGNYLNFYFSLYSNSWKITKLWSKQSFMCTNVRENCNQPLGIPLFIIHSLYWVVPLYWQVRVVSFPFPSKAAHRIVPCLNSSLVLCICRVKCRPLLKSSLPLLSPYSYVRILCHHLWMLFTVLH